MKPLKLCPVVREQVESDILPASRSQDRNSALLIRVFIKKRRGIYGLMDSFWCIRSSERSKKTGASRCYVPAVCVIVYACHRFV